MFSSLFVCLLATYQRICMKFAAKVGNGPTNKRLNFGGDPDPYRDTGKTCLGGGMHCPRNF